MRRFKAIYLSQSESGHDNRFLSTLRKKFEVETFFLDNHSGGLSFQEFRDVSIIIATPLSGGITAIDKSTDIPIVGICMAYEINEEAKKEKNKKQIAENINRCAGIICDSKYIENQIRNEYRYSGKILRTPYGCEQQLFSKIEFSPFQKLRIISTRNWTSLHSNETILEALEILALRNIDFEVLMLGDGPQLLEAKKRKENLQWKNIEFGGGYINTDLVDKFRQFEVYISASLSDGTSVSLLEALSAGRICICRDFPSNVEWIEHGVTGFLFNDVTTLADILEEINVMSFESREKISAQARLSALNIADWEKNEDSFLTFIENMARK